MVSTEMSVIIGFVFLMVIPLLLYAGRVAQGEREVRTAARAGARAATLKDREGDAERVARETIESNLEAAGMACGAAIAIIVDTSQLYPGGEVTVDVSCIASMSDMAAIGVPGTKAFRAVVTEVVDTHRSDP